MAETQWATRALKIFDATAHVSAPEISELQAAGVTQAKIDSLYPFDPLNYRAKLSALCSTAKATRSLLGIFEEVDVYEALKTLIQNPGSVDEWGGSGMSDTAWEMTGRLRFSLAQQRGQYLGYAGSLLLLPTFLKMLPALEIMNLGWGVASHAQRKLINQLPAYCAVTQGVLNAVERAEVQNRADAKLEVALAARSR